LPGGSTAEEINDRLAVFLGRFHAGYVTAAREHDELGSGDGAGNRLGLGGTADEVELAGHDQGRAGNAAQQRAQVNRLVQAALPGFAGVLCGYSAA
jgi:hypothetical protein